MNILAEPALGLVDPDKIEMRTFIVAYVMLNVREALTDSLYCC